MSAESIDIDPRRRIVEFAIGASTEITSHDGDAIPELAAILPPGTVVYVAHTPKATLAEVAGTAIKVEAAGLACPPHIVARRNPRDARNYAKPRGGWLTRASDRRSSSRATSSRRRVRIRARSKCWRATSSRTPDSPELGVAGHPEGHRAVDTPTLWERAAGEAGLRRAQGRRHAPRDAIRFDASAICRWGRELRSQGVRLPVHVGMAGARAAHEARQVRDGLRRRRPRLRGALRSMQTVRHIAGLLRRRPSRC